MPLSRFYSKAKLDLLLGVVALLSFWLMLSASGDPLVSWLKGTRAAGAFEQFTSGNQIAFDLSVGVLSAIGMFYLLVRLPEYERKVRIKRHLQFSYRSFKQSVIQIFLGCVQRSYNTETVDRLLDQREFRAFFKQTFVPGQTKWDGVANKMNDFVLRQLVLETEILLNEFQQALSAVEIRDPEVYAFMKRMSRAMYRAKNWSSDYDGTKEVLGFFWSVLSGWSGVDGYSEREYIADMISAL